MSKWFSPPPLSDRSQAMCLDSRMMPLTYDFPLHLPRGRGTVKEDEGSEVGGRKVGQSQWPEAEFLDGNRMLLLWTTNQQPENYFYCNFIGCSQQQHSISIPEFSLCFPQKLNVSLLRICRANILQFNLTISQFNSFSKRATARLRPPWRSIPPPPAPAPSRSSPTRPSSAARPSRASSTRSTSSPSYRTTSSRVREKRERFLGSPKLHGTDLRFLYHPWIIPVV